MRAYPSIVLFALLVVLPPAHGLVGFGVDSSFGAGGAVLRVTNLDAEGPGSLRAALETTGPRMVVFEVGGVIDLERRNLRIREPFLTLAGQTAPSPGITLIRGGITIGAHDVLIQHIRVRPGDAGEPKGSGWEPDGIGTSGEHAYNIVIDHCSVTWAVDENLSASGPRTQGPEGTSRRITFRNCIIAEALDDSSHEKGPHSMGSLIHDFCRDIAIIGNLYAHNADRNPYFKAFTTGVIVNNVIYNPAKRAIRLGFSPGEWTEVALEPENCRVGIVGNVLLHGPDTPADLAMVSWRGDAYMEDNIALDREGNPAPLLDGEINPLEASPVWPAGLTPLPAADVLEAVARNVGARPADRDEVDARIIRQLQARQGHIIDSQDEVGGYPEVEMTRRPLEVPLDDVPSWLDRLAADLVPSATHDQPDGP